MILGFAGLPFATPPKQEPAALTPTIPAAQFFKNDLRSTT
jgi:hypothetical protein